MQLPKRKTLRCVASLTLALGGPWQFGLAQDAPADIDVRSPVASIDEPLPADPVLAQLRIARNDYFPLPGGGHTGGIFTEGAPFDAQGIHVCQFDQGPRSIKDLTQKATAIFDARVEAAAAFVSTDRNLIHGEFDVRIASVLKDAGPTGTALESGQIATVLRPGGAVRFPSGKLMRQEWFDLGQPLIGGRYMFFVLHAPEIQAFEIVALYEIDKDGLVTLMDRSGWPAPSNNPVEAFRSEILAALGEE